MSTRLDDLPLLQHDNPVSAPNRRQPVRDNNPGPPLQQSLQGRLNLPFGVAIDIRCRFVERPTLSFTRAVNKRRLRRIGYLTGA